MQKKSNLKGALGVDTSNLAAKPYLPSLRARVDKIDKDKLKTAPADLSKPSNILQNVIDKKTVYDKLVTRVNTIDTSRFVLKTWYKTWIN